MIVLEKQFGPVIEAFLSGAIDIDEIKGPFLEVISNEDE